jgi:hypothetical protein
MSEIHFAMFLYLYHRCVAHEPLFTDDLEKRHSLGIKLVRYFLAPANAVGVAHTPFSSIYCIVLIRTNAGRRKGECWLCGYASALQCRRIEAVTASLALT